MVDPIEELFQIEINDPSVALRDILLRLGHGVMCGATRSEPIAVLGKRRIPLPLQNLHYRLLDKAIQYGWHGCFELHIGPVSLWDRSRSLTPFIPSEVISLLC
jgi:hypothetical protein